MYNLLVLSKYFEKKEDEGKSVGSAGSSAAFVRQCPLRGLCKQQGTISLNSVRRDNVHNNVKMLSGTGQVNKLKQFILSGRKLELLKAANPSLKKC
jgi:hypothetical protein